MKSIFGNKLLNTGLLRTAAGKSNGFLLSAILAVLCAVASNGAWASSTINRGIHAVPAPVKVSVDGKLDDWDLSGKILICPDVETMRDSYAGEVALMYDADNLYVSVHWKDPVPMGNAHDPRVNTFGFGGDCLQLRLVTDKVVHVTAWYYAVKSEPFINLSFGKGMSQPFGGGSRDLFQTDGSRLQGAAEMACLKDADGKGYVQELKLPWTQITESKRYKPGEQFTCGVELLWGEGAGNYPMFRIADNVVAGGIPGGDYYRQLENWGPVYVEEKGNLKLPPAEWELKLAGTRKANSAKIRYQLPADGPLPQTYRVTLAVTDPDNSDWIVSQPVCGAVRTVTSENKGIFEEAWDGLDDNFMPLPPGRYGVKGILMKARKWEINGEYHSLIPKIAAAPGDSWFPVRNEDDRQPWMWAAGDGGGMISAVAVGEDGKAAFLSGYMEGDGCWLVDLKKPVSWHQVLKAYGASGSSAATDGKAIWAVQKAGKDWFICRVDGGKFGSDAGVGSLASTYRPAGVPTAMAAWLNPEDGKRFLYVARTRPENGAEGNDSVLVLEGDSGAKLAEIQLRNPQGLAVNGRRLIALSQDTADRWVISEFPLIKGIPDVNGVKSIPINGIAGPTDIQADSRGFYYLSDMGHNQVYQVDATGKIMRRFGRADRQTPGKYDRNIFMAPGKLAFWSGPDTKGRLIVVEKALGRVSEWSTDGELLREWILGVSGDNGYCADPEKPEHIYVMADGSNTGRGLLRFKVDYASGEWNIDAVWPDICGAGLDKANWGEFPGGSFRPQIINFQGRKYLAFARTHQDRYGYIVYRQDGDNWVPSAGLIPLGTGSPKDNAQIRLFRQWFWWSDANGDGKLQEEEYKDNPANLPGSLCYWGNTWLSDLSLTWMSRGYTVWKTSPTGFDRHGNPVFDGKKWDVLLEDTVFKARAEGNATPLYGGNEMDRAFGGAWQSICGSLQDGFYVNVRSGPNCGANTGAEYKLSRYVPDGKGGYRMKWRVGRAMYAHGNVLEPGDIGGSIFITEPVNGLFGVQDSTMGGYHIYTTDGIYVDTLFIDFAHYPEVGGVYRLGGENFGGMHFMNKENGKVYVAMAGNHPCPVFEVEGWTVKENPVRSLRLLDSSITLKKDQIAPAAELAAGFRGITPPRLARFPRTATQPALDGSLGGWEQAKTLSFQSDAQQKVEVKCLYDAETLYLRWQLHLPRQVKITLSSDTARIFTHEITADTVGFYIQGDPNAKPKSSNDGRAGDLRIVFGLVKDGDNVKPIAWGIYPKWIGPGKATPMTYRSIVSAVTFEHAGLLDSVKLGYCIDADKQGFVIAAAIPRSLIPLLPALGPEIRTNVNFEATLGGRNKFWWANTDGSASREVYDVPTEARLYPGSWAPVEFMGAGAK
ncbi:MAG: hypothetical protein WC637_02000 [Victivallales bacterium]|jgi:hypothetical protein